MRQPPLRDRLWTIGFVLALSSFASYFIRWWLRIGQISLVVATVLFIIGLILALAS